MGVATHNSTATSFAVSLSFIILERGEEFSSGQSVARYFNVKDLHHQLIDAVNNNTKYNGYYWKVKKEFPINVLKEGA